MLLTPPPPPRLKVIDMKQLLQKSPYLFKNLALQLLSKTQNSPLQFRTEKLLFFALLVHVFLKFTSLTRRLLLSIVILVRPCITYLRSKCLSHYNTLMKNRFSSELSFVQFYFKSSRYEVFLLYSVTCISLVKCKVLELIYTK
jgi:hypothetical protein